MSRHQREVEHEEHPGRPTGTSPARARRLRRATAWAIGGGILTFVAVAAASALHAPRDEASPRRAALAVHASDIAAPVRSLLAAIGAGALALPAAVHVPGRTGARARQPLVADLSPLWQSAFEGLGEPYARMRPVRHVVDAGARTRDVLYRPPPSPDMWLTQVGAPYAAAEPGKFELRVAYVAGTISHSLFQAGQEAGLSDLIILKLAEIFGWDIDFALDVHAGDSFSVIYEEKYLYGRKTADGAILAAEFSNQGEIYRAIGFRNEDGAIGYYAPDGRNLRRPFLRTPVKFSRVSSSFSPARYHPILKTWRAHRGVDYAAPAGTPVRATANGRVSFAGRHGGYGKMMIIDHGRGYRTLYGHLGRFRRGIETGHRVRQGDVVGYVGQTGLATGPHLHYEFQVNGVHKDPLTFEFPGGEPIAPSLRDRFNRVAAEWMARLDLIAERQMAAR